MKPRQVQGREAKEAEKDPPRNQHATSRSINYRTAKTESSEVPTSDINIQSNVKIDHQQNQSTSKSMQTSTKLIFCKTAPEPLHMNKASLNSNMKTLSLKGCLDKDNNAKRLNVQPQPVAFGETMSHKGLLASLLVKNGKKEKDVEHHTPQGKLSIAQEHKAVECKLKKEVKLQPVSKTKLGSGQSSPFWPCENLPWYQIPTSSSRKHKSGIYSEKFQTSLAEYILQRNNKIKKQNTVTPPAQKVGVLHKSPRKVRSDNSSQNKKSKDLQGKDTHKQMFPQPKKQVTFSMDTLPGSLSATLSQSKVKPGVSQTKDSSTLLLSRSKLCNNEASSITQTPVSSKKKNVRKTQKEQPPINLPTLSNSEDLAIEYTDNYQSPGTQDEKSHGDTLENNRDYTFPLDWSPPIINFLYWNELPVSQSLILTEESSVVSNTLLKTVEDEVGATVVSCVDSGKHKTKEHFHDPLLERQVKHTEDLSASTIYNLNNYKEEAVGRLSGHNNGFQGNLSLELPTNSNWSRFPKNMSKLKSDNVKNKETPKASLGKPVEVEDVIMKDIMVEQKTCESNVGAKNSLLNNGKSLQRTQAQVSTENPKYSFIHYKDKDVGRESGDERWSQNTLLTKLSKSSLYTMFTDNLPISYSENFYENMMAMKSSNKESSISSDILENMEEENLNRSDDNEKKEAYGIPNTPDKALYNIDESLMNEQAYIYSATLLHPHVPLHEGRRVSPVENVSEPKETLELPTCSYLVTPQDIMSESFIEMSIQKDIVSIDSDEEDDSMLVTFDNGIINNFVPSVVKQKHQIQLNSDSSKGNIYINSLDSLLEEKNIREQSNVQFDMVEKELKEYQLVPDTTRCFPIGMSPGVLFLTEKQRLFMKRYSVGCEDFPSTPPGEEIFCISQMLHYMRNNNSWILDISEMQPQHPLEQLFFSSCFTQQVSLLKDEFLTFLYSSVICPQPVFCWLFQLMSSNTYVSLASFKTLWDISIYNLKKSDGSADFVWCPSLQNVVNVLQKMGAKRFALYPLKRIYEEPSYKAIKSSQIKEDNTECMNMTPRHTLYSSMLVENLSNVFKFLTLCGIGRPHFLPEQELLIFISMLCRVSLDNNLRNRPKEDLRQLLLTLLNNLTEWPSQLPRLCWTLSDISPHHHNLLSVVQLIPDTFTKSQLLKKQLSLVIISKLLSKSIGSPSWNEKARLSFLCRLLKDMKPSTLKQQLLKCHRRADKETEWQSKVDWEAYYLCHTLLTLANIVVGTQTLTADKLDDLHQLCIQLERHIISNIREGPGVLYRSKLKDLATYTHVKWQDLLSQCKRQSGYRSLWVPCLDFRAEDEREQDLGNNSKEHHKGQGEDGQQMEWSLGKPHPQ